MLATVPLWVGNTYYVNIATQILLYAVFALGLNVLVGYAGLVTLGHAGLFGIAAYAGALIVNGGHGHVAAVAGAVLVSLAAAAIFAALALRGTGLGFVMITVALGQITWGVAYRWISITNGDNGVSIRGRPMPLGLSLASAEGLYWATLVVFLIAVASIAIFAASPFGASVRGTRDQPRRMNALGYHVWMIRFCACLFSGLLERRRRPALRLLQPVHQPADARARRLRRGAADGHRRRHGDPARARSSAPRSSSS